MAKNDDSLFLLEVLIDKIVFAKSPCFSDRDFRTCVNIECPSVQPLEICDDDPGACIARSGGPFVKTFNNGKSCLFSLKESEISSAMSKFPVKISVYKSLPCGCLPTKITMGEATIDMTKEFVQARNKFLEDPTSVSYQALKDSFRIVGPDGVETGEIVMFLRISCFGKLIITRFQGGGGAPNLGAGGGNAIVDRSCAPKRDFQTAQEPCACGAARGGSGRPGSGYDNKTCISGGGGGGGVCHSARDPYNSMPCEDPDDPCFCSGPMQSGKQNMACRNTDQYCLHVPKGRSKQFEEIGTNLGGNELKIKVPASASIIKKISQTHCAMQCPYTKGADGGPCEPPCGKNQISLALPCEAICCQGAQPAGTQFTCTTEGCVQASKHTQQIAQARGDTKQQELPNKEVFVLKVAKTAMQGDRKCRLELELVAPKGPDKKPPTETVNARLQSDLDCECCVRRLKKPKGKKKRYCCPTGNKVVFQIPSDSCGTGHKQRAHFNFTSDGVGDVARDEPGQLMPTTSQDYPGVVYDFPKQVIKLRIGKSVEMPGRKSKLEYQFITPVITYEKDIPVKDTRTAQCTPCCRSPCCSSRPKCAPSSENFYQELTGEQRNETKPRFDGHGQQCLNDFIADFLCGYTDTYLQSKMDPIITDRIQCFFKKIKSQYYFQDTSTSYTSLCSTRYTLDAYPNLMASGHDYISSTLCDKNSIKNMGMFSKKETEVYMTLYNDFCHFRASETQATAFINKCFQVNSEVCSRCDASTLDTNTNYGSSCTMSTSPSRHFKPHMNESSRYHNVYFFGRKKDASKSTGMGSIESNRKMQKPVDKSGAAVRNQPSQMSGKSSVINTASVQTNRTKGTSTCASTKAVSIKEDKPKKCCPAAGPTKGDMTATVSHIRIGPREPCPVHGKEPCQGPKCIVASAGEQQAPVKVSTVTNPRRGVFEIVIRKITGAPLAKNELMLEWTPPPSRPPPCGGPCPIPCAMPPSCPPSKCKMIVCRPVKCMPKFCRKPCTPSSCLRKKCCKTSCCGKKCMPCGPSPCKIPCSIPCAPPCCRTPCRSPCKSSPCLRPCPVGRKRARKARSQPKIKANRKRTSPCLNRSKACPVVRCRSMPGPCVSCCFAPPPCPPRKCCSVAPCKPPKCCKSSCSISCN